MNAIKFVKKFGWGEFKDLYQASLYVEPFQPPSEKIIGIKKSEIKELFDAFELVERYGGVLRSKSYLEKNKNTGSEINLILGAAINLVEQCQ